MRFLRALVLALLTSALAAGCGGAGRVRTHVASTSRACVLSTRQRRAVDAAERDIRKLHRAEAPVEKYSYAGTPAMQRQTERVLLDVGRVKLPINTRAKLLREAKAASGLCGSCFGAFEAAEPAVVSRFGGSECG